MKRFNSVIYAIQLCEGLSISEMPLSNRSDNWWDKFWNYYGLSEAEKICS